MREEPRDTPHHVILERARRAAAARKAYFLRLALKSAQALKRRDG
jgi:hypothetical protein